jgi:hypothetical protein
MKYLLFILLVCGVANAQQDAMHCGYDFTSYVVLDVHESGKTQNIKNLRVTIVDSLGNDVINTNNQYSFKNAGQPLKFTFNYLIGEDNKRLPEGVVPEKERWFFPYAKDNYLISVVNNFPADNFQVKVEDVDGTENGGKFKTVIIPLFAYNMYVLCSNETRQAAMKFGRKMNNPIDVVLEKE